MSVSDLVGKTLVEVSQVGDDVIRFVADDGSTYRMWHTQDCCETVTVESVVGDLQDLVGTPILLAEEAVSCQEHPAGFAPREYQEDSFTWTFYKFGTIKGYVDIRWYGSSNGYYSESVSFDKE